MDTVNTVGGKNVGHFTDPSLAPTHEGTASNQEAIKCLLHSLSPSEGHHANVIGRGLRDTIDHASIDFKTLSRDLRGAISHTEAWVALCNSFRRENKEGLLDKTATLILIGQGRAAGISDDRLLEALPASGGLSIDQQAGEVLRYFFDQYSTGHQNELQSLIHSNFILAEVVHPDTLREKINAPNAGMMRFSDSIPVLGRLNVPYAFAKESGPPELLKRQTIGMLQGANLQGANLQGANLRYAQLQNAQLQNADLQGANLFRAQLQNAQLQNADLQGANLRYADLQGAQLQDAKLQGANLYEAQLQDADLRHANLQGVNLYEAQLQDADLRHANLQGVNLEGADLQGANLQGAQLQDADLRRTELQGANLLGADLQGVNLEGTHLQGANLYEAQLQDADLRHANLQGANLLGADLQGANLLEANLEGAILDGPAFLSTPYDLSRARLQAGTESEDTLRQRIKTLIGTGEQIQTNLDLYFNHRNNVTSLLTNIAQLDDSYGSQKQALMRAVVEELNNQSVSAPHLVASLAPSLGDVLFQDPMYLNDYGDFAGWLLDKLLGDGSMLLDKQLHDTALRAMGEHVANVLETKGFEAIAEHSVAIYQVLYAMRERAASAPQENWATQAGTLHEQYCKILSANHLTLMGTGGIYESELDSLADNDIFPLLAADGRSCVMMTDDAYKQLVLNDPSLVNGGGRLWDDLRCVQAQFDGTFPANVKGPGEGGTRGTASTASVLDEFPLLRSARQRDNAGESYRQLLALSGLNGALLDRFIAAPQQREISEKMTGPADQIALGEIFEKKYVDRNENGVHLAASHVAELRAFRPDDSQPVFAFRLLCLAMLYTNYASSAVFGEELESPNALRHYAEALLRKAQELDPKLLPDNTLGEWINKLRGLKNAFTCTSILYDIQSSYLADVILPSNADSNATTLHQIRDEMIPLAWRV